MDYKRTNNDINGNPRYIIHYLNFLTNKEKDSGVLEGYELAVKKSRSIGGKKYRGKDFGGGIVMQSYNIYNTIEQIKKMQQDETI